MASPTPAPMQGLIINSRVGWESCTSSLMDGGCGGVQLGHLQDHIPIKGIPAHLYIAPIERTPAPSAERAVSICVPIWL